MKRPILASLMLAVVCLVASAQAATPVVAAVHLRLGQVQWGQSIDGVSFRGSLTAYEYITTFDEPLFAVVGGYSRCQNGACSAVEVASLIAPTEFGMSPDGTTFTYRGCLARVGGGACVNVAVSMSASTDLQFAGSCDAALDSVIPPEHRSACPRISADFRDPTQSVQIITVGPFVYRRYATVTGSVDGIAFSPSGTYYTLGVVSWYGVQVGLGL